MEKIDISQKFAVGQKHFTGHLCRANNCSTAHPLILAVGNAMIGKQFVLTVTNKLIYVERIVLYMYSCCNVWFCFAVIILLVNLNCLKPTLAFFISAIFEKEHFSFAFRFVTHTSLLTSQSLTT